MSTSTEKKSKTNKVVDNLKTQLEELLETLDRLYATINEQLGPRIGSDFGEINSLLAEGFRSVIEGKPANDVIEDAGSDSEDSGSESGEYDSECSEEADKEAASEARQKSADEMMKLIKALTGASAH